MSKLRPYSWIEAIARLTFLIFSLSLASALADEKQLPPTTYHPQPVSALSSTIAAEKPTSAVMNFDAKAGISKDEADLLSERFAMEFGKLGKFQLIGRSKMKDVLELQKFARSDNCSATQCAIEAGRLLNAQFMVYGSIGKVGSTWTVNAALVSVETGAISNQAGVDVKGQVDDLLSSGMRNAARELAGVAGLGGGSAGEAPPVKPAAVSSGGSAEKTDIEVVFFDVTVPDTIVEGRLTIYMVPVDGNGNRQPEFYRQECEVSRGRVAAMPPPCTFKWDRTRNVRLEVELFDARKNLVSISRADARHDFSAQDTGELLSQMAKPIWLNGVQVEMKVRALNEKEVKVVEENRAWEERKKAEDAQLSTERKAKEDATMGVGKPRTVDLEGGVTMELVWVSAMNCWVGKYEVTNGEYRKFKADHNSGEYKGHSLNGGRQPVVMVNFDDAKVFADWLTERERQAGRLPEGYRFRLPSEDECLTFAQCGDGKEYPWGNNWPPPNDWNYHGQESAASWGKIVGHNDGFSVTCSVEKSGRNDWGLYGVGGNVWEVTANGKDGASFGAWLCASWLDGTRDYLRCSYRLGLAASVRLSICGFRLVLAPP